MENMTGSQSSLFWVVWVHLLMEFVEWEPEEVKGALLAQGCSANVAMYVAIKQGDKELLEAALAEGANLNWVVNGKEIVFEELPLHSVDHVGVLGTILDHTRVDQREALCKSLLHSIRWGWGWSDTWHTPNSGSDLLLPIENVPGFYTCQRSGRGVFRAVPDDTWSRGLRS